MHRDESETFQTLKMFHCYDIFCNRPNFAYITNHPSMVNRDRIGEHLCCFQTMFSVKMGYAVIISVIIAHADCCK